MVKTRSGKVNGDGKGVAVGFGEGVEVGVGVGVGVGGGGGGGDGAHSGTGPGTWTVMPSLVLKKPIVPFTVQGGPPSNLKLYKVPQRIAFAFGFWAKLSVDQDTPRVALQGTLL